MWGDKSFVESLCQHLLKKYLRCAYGYHTFIISFF